MVCECYCFDYQSVALCAILTHPRLHQTRHQRVHEIKVVVKVELFVKFVSRGRIAYINWFMFWLI